MAKTEKSLEELMREHLGEQLTMELMKILEVMFKAGATRDAIEDAIAVQITHRTQPEVATALHNVLHSPQGVIYFPKGAE